MCQALCRLLYVTYMNPCEYMYSPLPTPQWLNVSNNEHLSVQFGIEKEAPVVRSVFLPIRLRAGVKTGIWLSIILHTLLQVLSVWLHLLLRLMYVFSCNLKIISTVVSNLNIYIQSVWLYDVWKIQIKLFTVVGECYIVQRYSTCYVFRSVDANMLQALMMATYSNILQFA